MGKGIPARQLLFHRHAACSNVQGPIVIFFLPPNLLPTSKGMLPKRCCQSGSALYSALLQRRTAAATLGLKTASSTPTLKGSRAGAKVQ